MNKEFDMYGRRSSDHTILSLQDYLELSQERKEYAQYVVMSEQNNWRNEFVREFREYKESCDAHFKKLYKRKFMDKTTALITGFIGGFLGYVFIYWAYLKDYFK